MMCLQTERHVFPHIARGMRAVEMSLTAQSQPKKSERPHKCEQSMWPFSMVTDWLAKGCMRKRLWLNVLGQSYRARL